MSETPLLPMPHSVHRMRLRHKERFSCPTLVGLVLPASIVAALILFVFTTSTIDIRYSIPWKKPDFSHHKFLQTLPHTHFPIHLDSNKRVIAFGDVHGMNQSLSALLDKISYDPELDTLIHLGDLVSKKRRLSSIPILDFMSANHILGVRGNNDQKVIEWRAWMDWITSLPGGREWLEDMNAKWSHIDGDEPNPEFDAWLQKSHRKWKPYVPGGWKLQGKHYRVARVMSQEHFRYLCSLPLVLYAPAAHTYLVHAGLLPADPTRKLDDPKQPLSHFPTTPDPEDGPTLRHLQELALLDKIPQNKDPWTLMNMRSLTKGGRVKSGKKGTPWSDLWNDVMGNCAGLSAVDSELPTNLSKHGSATPLECFPSMVIYGHAAVRDLDVKRWSVGVDTGCAYGRRLTAVVLDANSFSPHVRSDASLKRSIIPYGDEGTAQVVSVKCRT